MLPDLPRNFDNKVTDVSQLNLEAVESEMIVCYTCTINNEEAAEGNVDETKENGNTEQDEQCVDIVECKKRLREAYETILMYEVPLDDLESKLHRRIRMRLTDSRALLNNSKEQTDQSYFTSTKIKLDHHKGVYGILAMLKCIADDYSFASVDKFCQVKTFFLHAADNKLHLWSVRYQADGLFDLWRESCLKIRPNFEDRVEFLPQMIKFCWNTKRLLEQAVNHLIEVKNEHQGNISKYRYNPEQFTQLSKIVNPVIMKLTKEEDGAGMGYLGPIYSPPHY
ncbi:hypothetical protein G6F43_003029 [Rhizopus delemar]|nr:hypothetical protein G6F43_003029 [Rhizopus delemar]